MSELFGKTGPQFKGIVVDEGYEVAATHKGVAIKTALLLLIAVASGFLFPLMLVRMQNPTTMLVLLIGMTIGAGICGFVGQIFPTAAKVCSFIYAICEGGLLGLVSYVFEAEWKGIVLMAVIITVTLFSIMLLLYSIKAIRATNGFIKFFIALTVTLAVSWLVYLIAGLINPNNALAVAVNTYSWLMYAICGFLILYGCLMLVMDFHHVDVLVAGGFDKRYEWNAALGLMITVVWIYIEALRLLAIIMSKKD